MLYEGCFRHAYIMTSFADFVGARVIYACTMVWSWRTSCVVFSGIKTPLARWFALRSSIIGLGRAPGIGIALIAESPPDWSHPPLMVVEFGSSAMASARLGSWTSKDSNGMYRRRVIPQTACYCTMVVCDVLVPRTYSRCGQIWQDRG